jgi:hypothetical protein
VALERRRFRFALARRSRSEHVWPQATWLARVGTTSLVSLCVIVQCLGWGGSKAVAIPFEAKSGFMGAAKNVLIFDHSKKEQQATVSAKGEVSPVFGWDKLTTRKERGFLAAAEDKSRRHVACARIPEFGGVSIDHLDINIDLSQDRWCFSLVSKSGLNLQDFSRKRAISVGGDLMFEFMPQKQIGTLDPGDVLGGNSGRYGGGFSGAVSRRDQRQPA